MPVRFQVETTEPRKYWKRLKVCSKQSHRFDELTSWKLKKACKTVGCGIFRYLMHTADKFIAQLLSSALDIPNEHKILQKVPTHSYGMLFVSEMPIM